LNRIKELIDRVNIVNDESSSWNCQDWSLDALDKLAEEGFVHEYYTKAVVKYWLREEQDEEQT
jgi:hypothetical protein